VDAQLRSRRDGGTAAAEQQGKAAIANARLAHEIYSTLVGGDDFRALRAAGASPQRLLWASTSTKDPAYRDVYYVEELIGPDTVNTMPRRTLEAFADHGVVAGATVASDYPGAHRVMARLAELGIEMSRVADALLDAGLVTFRHSYDEAVAVIRGEMRRLRA
jgi:transaldolase